MTQDPPADPFDRLYSTWAKHALGKNRDPPSRARWDTAVLFLLSSKDPDRIKRYANVEATGQESLGADAYDLWSKMPAYTPDLTAVARTVSQLSAYEVATRGSMKRLMEERGLLEQYNALCEAQEEYWRSRKAKARRGQTSVLIMGCAGLGAIAIMVLTVLLIIALGMNGG